MKVPINTKTLLTALTLTHPVFSQTVDDALTQFAALRDRIDGVQSSINTYGGGVVLALPVANSIYNAHNAATTARTTLAALEPLSPEDSQRALDAYNEVHPRLIRALEAGQAKVGLFQSAGITYVSRALLSLLYTEKNLFEGVLREKVDPEYFQEDLAAALDQEFRDTLVLFQ